MTRYTASVRREGLGPILQEVARSSERQPEQSLYRDVRTVFERLNDTSIYIPTFRIIGSGVDLGQCDL